MAESFTCPRCGATSHNPTDVEEGYCGACHDFTGGAQSALAFGEWLETGKIPEWRQRYLIDAAVRDAIEERLRG